MNTPRMRLKHAAGWFAAGREMAEAMGLLADAAFKVFFWLCLHAERSSGRLLVEPETIARSVGKTEGKIIAILDGLFQREICRGGFLEITDRFWPYERAAPPLSVKDVWTYTAQVKELMQARGCVRSSFSATDYKFGDGIVPTPGSVANRGARHSPGLLAKVRGDAQPPGRHADYKPALFHFAGSRHAHPAR
jgi:hypothetical protein